MPTHFINTNQNPAPVPIPDFPSLSGGVFLWSLTKTWTQLWAEASAIGSGIIIVEGNAHPGLAAQLLPFMEALESASSEALTAVSSTEKVAQK